MARYDRIISSFFDEPWAIMPSKLEAIAEFIRSEIHVGISEEQVRDVVAASQRSESPTAGSSVSVIPIVGTLSYRINMMSAMSGGSSPRVIQNQLREAESDPNVDSVLLDIHSPGGSVYGIDELAKDIRRVRAKKMIVAQVNPLAASAAYYLASAADEIVITPSGESGSIGVYMVHVDKSKLVEDMGVSISFISAGKHKIEGHPYEPLSDDAAAHLKSRVDEYYDAFISAVAVGRGVAPIDVRNGFGEGRVLGAKVSVKEGLADRVGTIEETLSRITIPKKRRGIKRRAMQRLALTAGLLKNTPAADCPGPGQV